VQKQTLHARVISDREVEEILDARSEGHDFIAHDLVSLPGLGTTGEPKIPENSRRYGGHAYVWRLRVRHVPDEGYADHEQ